MALLTIWLALSKPVMLILIYEETWWRLTHLSAFSDKPFLFFGHELRNVKPAEQMWEVGLSKIPFFFSSSSLCALSVRFHQLYNDYFWIAL